MNNIIKFTEVELGQGWILRESKLPIASITKEDGGKKISNERVILIQYNDTPLGFLSFNLDENDNIHDVKYHDNILRSEK